MLPPDPSRPSPPDPGPAAAPAPPPARRRRVAWAWGIGVAALLLAPLPHAAESLTVGFAGLPLDKLVHLGLFLGLTGSWLRALPPGRTRDKTWIAAVVIAAIAFGGLLELIQSLPAIGRDGEWGDLLADALGALLSLPIASRFT
jgi:VanZ family protein